MILNLSINQDLADIILKITTIITRMGEVEGVSGHPGGSGGYSRGHRSTPSQESNTLSQVLRI